MAILCLTHYVIESLGNNPLALRSPGQNTSGKITRCRKSPARSRHCLYMDFYSERAYSHFECLSATGFSRTKGISWPIGRSIAWIMLARRGMTTGFTISSVVVFFGVVGPTL